VDLAAVKTSYRYWAPVYDYTFGWITRVGRRRTVEHINARGGRVLEIGVGTGLSLDRYAPDVEVTGIDVSPDMLDKARQKVADKGLTNVVRISEMDARHLSFPDGYFDTVVAMYVISVVPEPERVMEEMARVCKTGGEVLIVGHFARDKGALALVERIFAPLANIIGWHSDFEESRVRRVPSLQESARRGLPPFGIFTFLVQEKRAAAFGNRDAA